MELFPVSGRVTLKGEPLDRAELCFFGLDEALQVPHAPFPEAITDGSGEFALVSYDTDLGAPAGKYRVTLVCRRSDSADPEARELAQDVFGGKYESPEQSPLIVEIAAGENRLTDFDFP
ncbi:MAG: hypothetical protein AAGF97_15590 [Planctomycetota bacterium]